MEDNNGGEVIYKECLKNHSIALCVHTTDGCTEFIPDCKRPTGLYCGACGCHRNFHKVEQLLAVVVDEHATQAGSSNTKKARPVYIDLDIDEGPRGTSRKHTHYTEAEKRKMTTMAEILAWQMPGSDEVYKNILLKFCNEMGIDKMQFKSWMHIQKRKNEAAEREAGMH